MRVVQEPPVPPPVEKTCKHCKAVIEIEEADWETDSFKVSGYWFDSSAVCETLRFVVCPSCKKDILERS